MSIVRLGGLSRRLGGRAMSLAVAAAFHSTGGSPPAPAAPEFFGFATSVSDNTSALGPTATITPPSSMQAGDLVVVFACRRENSYPSVVDLQYTVSAQGGQRWSNWATTDPTYSFANAADIQGRAFWCTFNGSWSANPGWRTSTSANDSASTAGMSLCMLVFRATSTSKFWVPMFLPRTGDYSASGTTKSVSGGTTLTQHGSQNHVAVAAWFNPAAITYGSLSGTGWSQSGLPSQIRNTADSDHTLAFAYHLSSANSTIPSVSLTQSAGTAGVSLFLCMTEISLPAGGTGGSRALVQSDIDVINSSENPNVITFGAAIGSGNSYVGHFQSESLGSDGNACQPIFPIVDNQGNQAVVVQTMSYEELGYTGITYYVPNVTNAPTSIQLAYVLNPQPVGAAVHEITGGVVLDRYGCTWGFPEYKAEWQPVSIGSFTTSAPCYVYVAAYHAGHHYDPPFFDHSAWGGTKREEVGNDSPALNTTSTADINQSSAGALNVSVTAAQNHVTHLMAVALRSA